MRQYPGVMTGIVKSLEDPLSEGRIQVEFTWLPENNVSAWAPIAFPMAGKRRGMYFMPEVDDEVLVAFEHGDFNYPYVVGFLWNGVDLPPDEGINFSVRRLRTVSGHELEFYDKSGEEKVWLKTQGGHQILLDDVEKKIDIKTNGGQEVLMEDQPAKITIRTTGGNSIEIKDTPSSITLSTAAGIIFEVSGAPPMVTVNASSGMLQINCLQATITASSALAVTAPITTFSGVVQVSTLIATSVVSTTYTPGVGNLI